MPKHITLSRGPDRAAFRLLDYQDSCPEYARIPTICRLFGVSRPFVFESFHKGVKSLHIKRPGAQKGVRLVLVTSFREYLESFDRQEVSGANAN
jgi:hypothetical protein